MENHHSATDRNWAPQQSCCGSSLIVEGHQGVFVPEKPTPMQRALQTDPWWRQRLFLGHSIRLSVDVSEPQKWRTGFHPTQALPMKALASLKETGQVWRGLYFIPKQSFVKRFTAKIFTCKGKWFLLLLTSPSKHLKRRQRSLMKYLH